MSEEAINSFSPRAQQVLMLARKEADRLNHNFVGTEHLLLGLIKLGQGTAVNVLMKQGLNLENIRMEIEEQVGPGPGQKMIGNLLYSPHVQKVFALAAKEARTLNHTYIGTEHILLGLLREGDSVAARVLKNLNVDLDQTRQEIVKVVDPSVKKVPAEPGVVDPKQNFFTPRAQQVLVFARQEAVHYNHGSVDTEHLLLGLIRLGQGVAVTVLQKLGLNLENTRKEVEKQVGPGPDQQVSNIPYSQRVKKVLALAAKDARALHHTYVGTEHVLLGILAEGEGPAVQVLQHFNVDIKQVRLEILKELDPNFGL